jgi:hypothetical protein
MAVVRTSLLDVVTLAYGLVERRQAQGRGTIVLLSTIAARARDSDGVGPGGVLPVPPS